MSATIVDPPRHSPPPCDVCGTTRHEHAHSLRWPHHPEPFVLWRCRECGLISNWPRMDAQAIRGQYDGGYYIFSTPPAQRWTRATQVYLSHLGPLEDRVPGRRLLEIGCARGESLAIAKARGWEVQGIELSREAAEAARQDHQVTVTAGAFEDFAGKLGRFDVVLACDVIEHVCSPRAFLRQIGQHLKPGGVVIVETPNWGSPWRRLGGRRWIGINPFHIHLFSSSALIRLARNCGLTVHKTYTITNASGALWGDRPEMAGLRDVLPAGLQWRFQHYLNQITPSTTGAELQRRPSVSLDSALTRIAEEQRRRLPALDGSLLGDNLAVMAS